MPIAIPIYIPIGEPVPIPDPVQNIVANAIAIPVRNSIAIRILHTDRRRPAVGAITTAMSAAHSWRGWREAGSAIRLGPASRADRFDLRSNLDRESRGGFQGSSNLACISVHRPAESKEPIQR